MKKKIAGASVAGMLAVSLLIAPWEGNELKPYLDVGGVPTACGGVTGIAINAAYEKGITFTNEQCEALNTRAAMEHEKALRAIIADNVEEFIPDLTMSAFISWTYNVGPGAAQKSTLIRLVNAGDLVGACNQLPRWTRVKGAVVRGLENRRFKGDKTRLSEYTVCMIGLDPSYRTPLFDRLYFR